MKLAWMSGIVLAFALAVAAGEKGDKGGCPMQKADKSGCPMQKGGEGGGPMAKELGLTDTQKVQLKALRQEQRSLFASFGEKMRAQRDAVRAELAKAKPDQAALDKAAVEAGMLAEELAKTRISSLLKAKTILTAEQFSKLLDREWMMEMGPPPGGPRGGPGMKDKCCGPECKDKGTCPYAKKGKGKGEKRGGDDDDAHEGGHHDKGDDR
jgi:Spy/CpxP family protein refolding chaperone